MHYLAYLIPLLCLAGIYVYDPARIMSLDLTELIIVVAVAEALVGIAHAVVRYFGKDIEFLSGYVTMAKHHNAWTERQVYYVDVPAGNGKTRKEQRVRYVHHPDEWFWVLNTGHTSSIPEQMYVELVYRWGGNTYPISVFHPNCVAGGGGDATDWDQEITHVETETYEQRYTNPLDHSNSIFRYEEITPQQARERGLYDYPKIHNMKQDPIQGLDIVTVADQRAFQLLNAMHGKSRQVHFFVLLYDASKGLTIGEEQRAYWHGGNKNEFTICLGIEKTTDGNLLRWCNAFSWMDEPVLEMAIEDWARDQQDKPLNLQAFAQWLKEHLDLWKRKEWKDFAYLSDPMRPWQLLVIFLTAILTCVGIYYYLFSYEPGSIDIDVSSVLDTIYYIF